MKIKQIDNISDKDKEQLELSLIVGENTKWYRYFGKQFGSYLKKCLQCYRYISHSTQQSYF